MVTTWGRIIEVQLRDVREVEEPSNNKEVIFIFFFFDPDPIPRDPIKMRNDRIEQRRISTSIVQSKVHFKQN